MTMSPHLQLAIAGKHMAVNLQNILHGSSLFSGSRQGSSGRTERPPISRMPTWRFQTPCSWGLTTNTFPNAVQSTYAESHPEIFLHPLALLSHPKRHQISGADSISGYRIGSNFKSSDASTINWIGLYPLTSGA